MFIKAVDHTLLLKRIESLFLHLLSDFEICIELEIIFNQFHKNIFIDKSRN